MGSNFFIDKKLKKKIERDIKKRKDIEDKIDKLQEELKAVKESISDDLDDFYSQVDQETVLATIKYCEENCSADKKKKVVKEIEQRYISTNLLIEDTLSLTDWYEKMCKDYNEMI